MFKPALPLSRNDLPPRRQPAADFDLDRAAQSGARLANFWRTDSVLERYIC
jgi:hypothetical protein